MKRFLLSGFCLMLAVVMHAQDSLGIYAVKADSVYEMMPIHYRSMSMSSGMNGSKMVLDFAQATSVNRFKGVATFRLFFGKTKKEVYHDRYKLFAPSYSAKDFGAGRFEVSDAKRSITTSTVRPFGKLKAVDADAEGLKLECTELREHVYEVKVTGAPGEYCIMPMLKGMGGLVGVFDFTIE